MPLGGEDEYQHGKYPFEIVIPSDVKQTATQAEGKLGITITALKAISGATSRIDWYITANLDVPMKIEVSKTQSIVLS